MKLVVGQKLWFVPSDNRDPHEVTVQKVGRKWAGISGGHRIHVETLVGDGGEYRPPGRCHLDREVWEHQRALTGMWEEFRNAMDCAYLPPKGVTIGDIGKAMILLGLAPPPEPAKGEVQS